jgi:hemerythrin-like domain-containing protein
MLRDKSLIPLSRQHQHALALCVRINRASPIRAADLQSWQGEIAQQFEMEIKFHFVAEERVLFPVARRFAELRALVDDLLAEHLWLRACVEKAQSGAMAASDLSAFAERLSAHIRKEEQELFESLQRLLNAEELSAIGVQLEDSLKDATQVCRLPGDLAK